MDKETVFDSMFADNFDGIDHAFYGSIGMVEEKSIEKKYPNVEIDSEKLEFFLATEYNHCRDSFLEMLHEAVNSLSADELENMDEDSVEDISLDIYNKVLTEYMKHYKAKVTATYSKQELNDKGVIHP